MLGAQTQSMRMDGGLAGWSEGAQGSDCLTGSLLFDPNLVLPFPVDFYCRYYVSHQKKNLFTF